MASFCEGCPVANDMCGPVAGIISETVTQSAPLLMPIVAKLSLAFDEHGNHSELLRLRHGGTSQQLLSNIERCHSPQTVPNVSFFLDRERGELFKKRVVRCGALGYVATAAIPGNMRSATTARFVDQIQGTLHELRGDLD